MRLPKRILFWICASCLCTTAFASGPRFVCDILNLAKLSIDMSTESELPSAIGRTTPVAGRYRVEGRFHPGRLQLLPPSSQDGPSSVRIEGFDGAPARADSGFLPANSYLSERNLGVSGEYDPHLLIFLRILDDRGTSSLELEYFGPDHPENRFHILALDDIGPTRLFSNRIDCRREEK